MIRDFACVGVVVLAVLALMVVAATLAGAATGLFIGALFWGVETLAGPFAQGGISPWWALALLALILLADALRARRRRAERRPRP